MAVTAKMVKELREMTGAGMMDCKKALNETNGDMDAAIEFLRKNGEAKAVKKAGRIAAEGIVMADVKDDKTAAIVEVNSETDFVAKNAEFQGFVKSVVNQAIASDSTDMEGFMAEAWNEDASKTVQDALNEKISVIGEKLSIRRFEKVVTDGCVVSYIHGGGRIGVLVEAETDVVNDEIRSCLKNVAMQVAAMSPKYTSRDEVDASFLEHEKEILLAQAKQENPNKPDNIIEKMIIGRLNKEMKEICLLDQVYVQDSDLTVAKYVEKVAKENGANMTVKKFVRFETGEADCGGKLYYCTSKNFEARQDHFVCSTSRLKGKEVCPTHFIRAVVLEQGVLAHMRLVIACVSTHEERFRKAMGAKQKAEAKKELAAKRRQLTQAERRIEELDRLFKSIYEDNANGKISDSRFQMLSDDYEQEQEELREKLLQLNEEILQLEEQAENIDRFICKVRKYLDLDELTPAVLNDMVKAVYVHTPDKSNGHREQQIDISYDLVGILPASLLGNLSNGETA